MMVMLKEEKEQAKPLEEKNKWVGDRNGCWVDELGERCLRGLKAIAIAQECKQMRVGGSVDC